MTGVQWLWWGACCVLGGLLLALPDADNRLVSFSESHGPSPLDTLGLVILIGGWVVLYRSMWAARAQLATAARDRPSVAFALAFVAGVGLALLVTSVLADLGYWWAVGAVMLAGPQLVAALSITGRRSSPGRVTTV